MVNRTEAARTATFAALRLRYRAGVSLTDPANPIDVAQRIGVPVAFLPAPSLEGMVVADPHPQILLSSLRPRGRINFTCAHELGHHCFGHSLHIDVFDSTTPMLRSDADDEFVANRFASAFLMPKTTVQGAFAARKADIRSPAAADVLAIADWLGVGYTTLVHYLKIHLDAISKAGRRDLLKNTRSSIVSEILGGAFEGPSVLVDRNWRSRPIDLIVGETAVVDGDVSLNGPSIELDRVEGQYSLVRAVAPGAGRIDGDGAWSTPVRVSRPEFQGLARYRHLEEADDDDA